ncbi:glycogen debranching enzyme N-terminal domain-containing protein [Capnocytophaga sputigena]|uniref:Amylo-alpha-1,6-glucosidase n=1 Tax=Capnocytophaga sputigena TaxID=1019 RepID=A0AAX2IFB7_CAPSP|nr:glycogen debranching enzyme N-terminal domain-containing protein [Capnocytophaga sputigena]ATA84466.1 amylo-alpha-1,6-glucosidase [Capnocytophaga sputigena]EEB65353.1 putative glycogen debranching enzyme, archaeal type [Capnocytophaga sputigena ATCC 33612]SQA75764.1 putative glycogen debranching enzyme, archaeal type [Capnocytophaga sputigena]
MSYLSFKKDQLINLEYSLAREFLGTNRGGGYCSSTLVFCNTRKYHGLLVVPIEKFRGKNYVMLSSLDETILQHGRDFNFGVHKYEGTYEPRGHKYIVDISYEKAFTVTYQVGGVVLKKEILMMHNAPQVLIRYTLEDAHSATLLRLNPLLAFRDIHSLSKQNPVANTQVEEVDGGVRAKLYPEFPYLYMQLSKPANFGDAAYWNNNIYYTKEKERGYDFQEDLLSVGAFEVSLKKGESIVFSASLEEAKSKNLAKDFTKYLKERADRNSFEECLQYTASQFIIQKAGETRIKAGYHWYDSTTRDTFIALPGIALSGSTAKIFDEVLQSALKYCYNGRFARDISTHIVNPVFDADTSLWFFWTLQQYEKETTRTKKQIWKEYGETLKAILNAFKSREHKTMRMDDNGLIWSDNLSRPLTWFNAESNYGAIVPRNGYVVEVNALWYNAVCYALELAKDAKDKTFLSEWGTMPETIAESFNQIFWIESEKYLADYANNTHQNTEVRPNQLLACALDYSALSEKRQRKVLAIITQELLTPKGLRSLSPESPRYEGESVGNVFVRDKATFNGSVHPWFVGFYVEANLKLFGDTYIPDGKAFLENFEEEINTHGVGLISAIYDGNPPFNPRGCISNAKNVAEILRAQWLLSDKK